MCWPASDSTLLPSFTLSIWCSSRNRTLSIPINKTWIFPHFSTTHSNTKQRNTDAFILLLLLYFLSFCSYRDWKHEFRRGPPCPQPPLTSSSTPHLQALLCMSGQILRIPLWSQCLRRVQGRQANKLTLTQCVYTHTRSGHYLDRCRLQMQATARKPEFKNSYVTLLSICIMCKQRGHNLCTSPRICKPLCFI